jgi:hypothetical protein
MTSTQVPPQQQQQAGMPGAPAAPQQQGLPPTGLEQQLAGLKERYNQARNARIQGLGAVGVDVNAGAAQRQQSLRGRAMSQVPQAGQAMQAQQQGPAPDQRGATSLQALANRLAQSYGLAVGRDQLVDAAGNFMFTPDQIANSSGGAETQGTAAAKMNYIASALQRQQTQQSMQKSEAALQAGLGLATQRRSGSMIEQQSQFYQGLANLYQNQDYEAADFSYFIQKEALDLEMEIMRKAERLQKKKARGAFWGGVAMAGIGVATGNYFLAAQGAGTAFSSSGETGYF